MKHFTWKHSLFLLPMLMMALLFIFSPPTFIANDDVYMMKVFSGKITGEPYFETAFISVLIGFPISILYRIAHFPWFFAFQIGLTLFAQCIVMEKIANLFERPTFPKSFAWIVLVTALGLLFFTSKFITYTTVASLMGMASILKLFRYKDTKKKGELVLSSILLILSVAIRFASGVLAVAFWGIAYLYMLFTEPAEWKKLFCKGAIIITVLGLCVGFDWLMKHYVAEPQGYYDFMQAQADFVDYRKDDYELPHMQAIMKEYGWDNSLYQLATGYFTMDRRLVTEAYQAFNQYDSLRNASIRQILVAWKNAGDREPISHLGITMLIILASLQVCVVYFFGGSKKAKLSTFLYFCANAILFLVLAYILGKGGRLVARSILAILLPLFASLLGILGEGNAEYGLQKKHIKKQILIAFYVILFLGIAILLLRASIMPIALLALAGIVIALQYSNKQRIAYFFLGIALLSISYRIFDSYKFTYENDYVISVQEERNKLCQILEDYAIENPEYTLVTDLSFAIDFRSQTSKTAVNNILFWGGTNIHSHIFQQQLLQRGIEEYDLSILTREDIRLVIPYYEKTELLLKVLVSKGIMGEFELIEQVDSLQIYQFHQKS